MDKSATSTYAKIILSLCGFIVLGLIASDRQHAAAISMRQELVRRRFQAQDMFERINSLRNDGTLFLANLFYTKLVGDGAVFGSKEELFVTPLFPPETGFIGNYDVVHGEGRAIFPVGFPKEFLSLITEVKNVLATGNEPEVLRAELKRTITSKVKETLPEPQVDELVDTLLRSRGTVLSGEQVAWIVTGAVREIDLDRESSDATKFGLGYVEKFGALNDLPVFSAYEFVGLPRDDVYKRVKDYQTSIEKTLLSKTETENSVQVFGSGVSLGLSDLVIFAGPLIALFQLLYLIALRRELEGKSGELDRDQRSFSVPRFSSPLDPFRRPWPSSPELGIERVIYSAFLITPSAILLFGWLTRFSIDTFHRFTSGYGPYQTFFLANIIDSEGRGALAPALYVLAIGASCYALHRMVVMPGGHAKPRLSRGVIVSLACIITAIVALAVAVRQRRDEFYVGAAVYATCAGVAFFWETKPKSHRLLASCMLSALVIPVVLTIAVIFLPTNFASFLVKAFPQLGERLIPKLWVPIGFLLPSGKNVVLVVWILTASLLASMRRRHRLPTSFFFLAVCLTILCILW